MLSAHVAARVETKGMAQVNIAQIVARPTLEREKAVKILAKSIFKELKTEGYDNKQLIGLATELISLVTSDLADGSSDPTRR
jgi:hypothetical protein